MFNDILTYFYSCTEQKYEVERLKKLAYVIIILVIILGCTAIAGLAISVSNLKDSTDQLDQTKTEQQLSDACFSEPCANDATCLNTADVEEGYICICPFLSFGNHCQHGKKHFV